MFESCFHAQYSNWAAFEFPMIFDKYDHCVLRYILVFIYQGISWCVKRKCWACNILCWHWI